MKDPQTHTPAILFSSTLHTPFIEEDELILARHFRLETVFARGIRALLEIPGGVRRTDIALSWFGSVYAGYMVFWARLMGRRSVIVVAGVDAAREPEIRYGIWLNPWKARVVRFAYRHADKILVVDPSLAREVVRLARYDGTNILNIPFGFDGRRWRPGRKKERRVVTVAACEDEWKAKKKGIDKLFAAARELPDVPFCVIGIRESLMPILRAQAPENVELVSYVPRDAILPYLQKAKVYCQPSFTEGLPNALCEAMLCDCIPVGTLAGGIPTAIGSSGYLVPYGDHEALVGALRSALRAPASRGRKARERVLREFPLARREEALVKVIRELPS